MSWFNPDQNLFPNTTNGLYCLNLMKNFWVPKPSQAAKKYNEKETKQRMKTTWWESLQRSHKPLSAGWQTCDLLYHQWCSMVAFKRLLLAIQYCRGWLSRLGPQSWNIITSSCSTLLDYFLLWFLFCPLHNISVWNAWCLPVLMNKHGFQPHCITL